MHKWYQSAWAECVLSFQLAFMRTPFHFQSHNKQPYKYYQFLGPQSMLLAAVMYIIIVVVVCVINCDNDYCCTTTRKDNIYKGVTM